MSLFYPSDQISPWETDRVLAAMQDRGFVLDASTAQKILNGQAVLVTARAGGNARAAQDIRNAVASGFVVLMDDALTEAMVRNADELLVVSTYEPSVEMVRSKLGGLKRIVPDSSDTANRKVALTLVGAGALFMAAIAASVGRDAQ